MVRWSERSRGVVPWPMRRKHMGKLPGFGFESLERGNEGLSFVCYLLLQPFYCELVLQACSG